MSPDRRLHWSGYVYYYVAALIGLGFVLGGAVAGATGLLEAAAPRSAPDFRWQAEPALPFEEVEARRTPTPEEVEVAEERAAENVRAQGLYNAVQGGVFIAVGLPTFVWHIRRARRREEEDTREEPPRSSESTG